MVLDCGGMASFTQPFVYLGSLLHCDLSDHHGVEARIKNAAQAFGALRNRVFSSLGVLKRLKGKVYAGGRPRSATVRLRVVVPHGRGHHAPA
jgi:hypothetical protein